MSCETAVSPKIHYHIRWLASGELDWGRHDTRVHAEEAAQRLVRRDERYSIGRFELPQMHNGADRDLYERTKRDLAEKEWPDVQDYADAKTAVIEEILARL